MEEQSKDSVQVRRNELVHKCINLQVLKELLQKNEKLIQEKRSVIARQTNELDKLHQEVWSLQSKICDEVWNFSAKHNFLGIFINYPNIPSDLSLNCDCEGEENNKENVEAQQVRKEIQEIESALNDGSHDLLKEDLSRAEKELSFCKQESKEVQKLRKDINEAKARIANFKAKIESNAIQDNALDYLDMEYEFSEFGGFSPDSSAPANCPQSRNLKQLQSSQSVFPKNNNYYNRLAKHTNNNSNYDSEFVKASTLTRKEEIQSQFNNNPQCEKIVAEAVSNNDSAVVNQPKKKFVPKTKSNITQGKRTSKC